MNLPLKAKSEVYANFRNKPRFSISEMNLTHFLLTINSHFYLEWRQCYKKLALLHTIYHYVCSSNLLLVTKYNSILLFPEFSLNKSRVYRQPQCRAMQHKVNMVKSSRRKNRKCFLGCRIRSAMASTGRNKVCTSATSPRHVGT